MIQAACIKPNQPILRSSSDSVSLAEIDSSIIPTFPSASLLDLIGDVGKRTGNPVSVEPFLILGKADGERRMAKNGILPLFCSLERPDVISKEG